MHIDCIELLSISFKVKKRRVISIEKKKHGKDWVVTLLCREFAFFSNRNRRHFEYFYVDEIYVVFVMNFNGVYNCNG